MFIKVNGPVEFPDTDQASGKIKFGVGMYELTPAQEKSMEHWFVKGLIKEGRITFMGDAAEKAPQKLNYNSTHFPRVKIEKVGEVLVNGVSGSLHNAAAPPATGAPTAAIEVQVNPVAPKTKGRNPLKRREK